MPNSLKHSEHPDPAIDSERQKRIDQGWKIYCDYIINKTARAIVARLNSESRASPGARKAIEVTIGASSVPHEYTELPTDMKVSAVI